MSGELVRVQLPYGRPAWRTTRYADVRAVLADTRFSRALAVGEDEPRVFARVGTQLSILAMDPPEHTALRRVVQHGFTARRAESLRAKAEDIAAKLLDEMERLGPPADLVEDFAVPMAITVLSELLGVPGADQAEFRRWTDSLLSTAEELPAEQTAEARVQLGRYLATLLAQRKACPENDLLSAMVQAGDGQNHLELVKLGTTLLAAGFETVASEIGSIAHLLLTEPELLRALLDEPDRIPRAIDELLRFVPLGAAGGTFARVAREDVQLGGTLVRAGEAVVADPGAANRDETVFPDPDTVDFDRPNAAAHLTFGHGPHHCIGAQLARMELQVSFTALLSRLPKLRLAVPAEEIEWKNTVMPRCVSLPVEW
ncbi:cytochrome P450 [Lentzea sp. NBRC 105346]|uniref:cytochrome P450 n=1 Tax=Lentzea sp. NBRC 105346 TaxID=3032205 RepID=UPI0024A2A8F5|nr:cytochrome P450 [Lentzea sp. NBRC 105346]GLZ29253.1 cytochrome P450 [Lentzea sp. NBRC 105346]